MAPGLNLLRWLAALALIAASAGAQAFDHSHKAWGTLLAKHVEVLPGGKASAVRYAGLAADRATLKAYLDAVSAVGEAEFGAWTKEQRMAFLVNAYNAYTVEKVLTRYPGLKSIRDFGTVFGNPWKDRFFRLLGREQSLDGIEHGMLRKPGAYDEPRLHFALNCASIGCPMLREEPYVATRLAVQLEEQAVRFLSDRSRNRYSDGRLEVSKLFDWYKEDFGVREQYFSRYAKLLAGTAEGQAAVAAGRAPLAFLEYDWRLNEAQR